MAETEAPVNKEHTKLPWIVSSSLLVCDTKARVICSTAPMEVVGVTNSEAFANAAYIVLAANEYPKLLKEVESLRAFKRSVDEALNSGDGSYRP